jgi:hypothetical protein
MEVNFCIKSFELGELGFYVFPLRKHGKAPLTRNGFKDATDDEWVLADWIDKEPNANIGIPTGKINGITVVDLDLYKDGGESLRLLAKLGKKLTRTVSARTGKGGRHLFYKYHAGIRNSASKIAANVDIRSDGGYVVAPGSYLREQTDSGVIEGPYEWIVSPKEMDYAPLPLWIVEAVNRDTAPRKPIQPLKDKPAGNTTGLYKTTASAPKGQRNDALYWSACNYASNILEGNIARGRAEQELYHAASKAGLGQSEIAKTIASAFKSQGV